MNITGVDLLYIARELQAFVGGKVEKIMQSDKDKRDLLFTLYAPGQPKLHLRCVLPGLLCGYAEKPVYQKIPPGFAMFLRKYLANARIAAIQQRGFDRLLYIDLTTKEGDARLAFELIPPGNIVLVIDGKIKGLLEAQKYKDRALRGGVPYEPPYASVDVPNISDEELLKLIRESDRESIVTTLAMTCGLGGVYAEEVCARADIEKDRNDLSDEELATIVGEVRAVCGQEIAVHADGKRAYPFAMKSRAGETKEGTFLHALTAFVPKQQEKTDKKDKKLKTMVSAQEKNIAKQEKLAEESRSKGERLYEEFQLVEEILQTAERARKSNKDVGKALEKFPQVKSYNAKTQEIEVEL